jgi:hypothetical protein
MIFLAVLLSVLAVDPGTPPPSAAWRFVAPPPGDPFEHPPWRAISLSSAKPEDVVEKTAYRGRRRRYAQLRYGSPGSTRVTVVVDEVGPGEVNLYVDADRNRRIEDRDRVDGRGPVWRLPLTIAIAEEESTREIHREVVLRLGSTGRVLSVAAAGYLEGTVRLAGRDHAARRTDGDTDGSYTSPQDHLWVDLNDDGRWDPTTEQFLYAAILTIGPGRYAVRSDPAGTRLAFEPLEGTGTVRLTVRRPETRDHLAEIHAQLIGRDGSALNVNGSAEVTVPVGEYRISALSLVLSDPAGGPPWHFGFSEILRQPRRTWHKVEKGTVLDLDPLRGLELKAEIHEPPDERKPGLPVTILPRLITGDDLLINFGYRGAATAPGADYETTAHVKLCSSDGKILDATTSGFS